MRRNEIRALLVVVVLFALAGLTHAGWRSSFGLVQQVVVQSLQSLQLVSPNTAAQATPTAIYCADAVNGNNAFSGTASGTYPNFGNCKKTVEAACPLITAGSALYLSGIFHDPNLQTAGPTGGAVNLCAIPASVGGSTFAQPTTISSFGPLLASDPYSGASVSAWLDGADCVGQNTGDCAGQAAGPTWTLFSSAGGVNVYTTPWKAQPVNVYIDNITTWNDGPNADGAQGLTAASCQTGPCTTILAGGSGQAGRPYAYAALVPFWQGASHVYTAGSVVQAGANNGVAVALTQLWYSPAGGTATTVPFCSSSCTAGTSTFVDAGITWTFEGASNGKTTGMVKGTWWWDGQLLYIATLQNDSPANHVVEVADHYQGIFGNFSTLSGSNNFTIQHVGIRHTSDGLLWRQNTNTNCMSGESFLYNIITQTGEGNVDLNNFSNGFRVVGADHNCTPTNAGVIAHNFISYCGDHGGCYTIQSGTWNIQVLYNHALHANHADFNFVGNSPDGTSGNLVVGNFADSAGPTANQAVANDSVLGFYQEEGTSPTFMGNFVYNQYGTYCASGQCTGIDIQNSTGTINLFNNTIDTVQDGFYFATDAAASINMKGNIVNNLVLFSAPQAYDFVESGATVQINASDYNVWPNNGSGNIASINSVNKTFAQVQAIPLDTHSQNGSATFTPAATYPYTLATGSLGLGLTTGQGLLGANAGANQSVNGYIQ